MGTENNRPEWYLGARPAKLGGTIYSLQSWPTYFAATQARTKRHEIRNQVEAGITFKTGDFLELLEYDPNTKTYTGEKLFVKVTFISPTGTAWVVPGYAYMSIKVIDPLV